MADIIFPTVGNFIELESDFIFNLYHEHRNSGLFQYLGITDRPQWNGVRNFDGDWSYSCSWPSQWQGDRSATHDERWNGNGVSTKAVLPKGTILKIDRIYIRKGLPQFDSITFWAQIPGEKKKVRFWAKIIDINGNLKGRWL